MSFADVKRMCFVYKLIQNPLNGVFWLDQLTCAVCRNPINSGKWQQVMQPMLYLKSVTNSEVNIAEIIASETLFTCCFYNTIS